jgi:hypothetical protein
MLTRIATQNMTEGPVTDDLRNCGIAMLQEIDMGKLRSGFPKHFGKYRALRDKHQAIVWDKNLIKMSRRKRGWIRFHRSGEAERFPYGTPARGMLYMKGHLKHDPSIKIVVFSVWFLNSWNPMRGDQWTPHRRNVVMSRTLPVVRRQIQKWNDEGYLVIGGGDANSIKWDGELPGLKQPWTNGLDRIWLSPEIDVLGKEEGAKTGVGPQMYHRSRIVRVFLRK